MTSQDPRFKFPWYQTALPNATVSLTTGLGVPTRLEALWGPPPHTGLEGTEGCLRTLASKDHISLSFFVCKMG